VSFDLLLLFSFHFISHGGKYFADELLSVEICIDISIVWLVWPEPNLSRNLRERSFHLLH
jgi:hypothetical protein